VRKLPSIYDEIKRLYEALNMDSDVKKAKEILSGLVERGVDRDFIAGAFKTLAVEKMALYLYDEVEKERKKP